MSPKTGRFKFCILEILQLMPMIKRNHPYWQRVYVGIVDGMRREFIEKDARDIVLYDELPGKGADWLRAAIVRVYSPKLY